jgi:hypothetical protein
MEELELIKIITARFTKNTREEFAKRSKTNDITNKEIRKIERDLTRLLKRQIEKQGHIDTGLMVRTITVEVKPDARGKMVTKIFAVDYWKYVNGNFDILENAEKTRAWKKIEGDFNFLNRGIR